MMYLLMQMHKQSLIEILLSLRGARENLVSRTIKEEPQLFSTFFEFENNDNMLELSFEREFSIFLNNNLEFFSNTISEPHLSFTRNKLKYIVEEFVCSRLSDDHRTSNHLDVFFLKNKIDMIDEIFSVAISNNEKIERIRYVYRKEQVLFDREFKKLRDADNELD